MPSTVPQLLCRWELSWGLAASARSEVSSFSLEGVWGERGGEDLQRGGSATLQE